MKRILTLIALFTIASTANAQTLEERIRALKEQQAAIAKAIAEEPEPKKESPNPSTLIVEVQDESAIVYIDGVRTSQTGYLRKFESDGKRGGTYEVRVGSETKSVRVSPGDTVRVTFGEAVGRMASPFYSGEYPPQTARRDDSVSATGPWLPKAEQDKIKAMWPKGVEFPHTLKFYKLKTASQSVASFNDVNPGNNNPVGGNNRPFLFPHMGSENANREFPWIGSGGMDFATPGTWRNATGLALPPSKNIRVWTAPMRVSTQYEVGLHWDFPKGTQVFDVLIRRNDDGSEHIFNVRRRTKVSDKWDDGVSFMPDVQVKQGWSREDNVTGTRVHTVLGLTTIKYRGWTVKSVTRTTRFKESADPRVALEDGGKFFPPGFVGTGLTCNKCHSAQAHEKQTYGGPLLRGKDTVFSWYPVRADMPADNVSDSIQRAVPVMDYRWPIEFLGNYQEPYGN